MIFPRDWRLPPYNTAATRPVRSNLRPRGHDVKLDRRPVVPEGDHVTVCKDRVARDAHAVDERAVGAAQIPHHERVTVAHDAGVTRGHIEIALGVEADV